MSDLMREEFEFKFPLPSGVAWKESIGMYEVVDVWKLDKPMTIGIYNCRWEGWQASRECLVIELPVRSCIAAVSGMNYHKGWNDSLDWSRKNIEEYGIKVKP